MIRPSTAPHWGYCTGAAAAIAACPRPDTDASLRGTAGHWVGAQMLTGQPVSAAAPNGVVIDDEIVAGAQVWVDDVLATTGGEVPNVEAPLRMSRIHPQLAGTCDTHWLDFPSRTLYVWEYKSGHKEVPAPGNYQGVCFISGALSELPYGLELDRIVFRVAQPFCYTSSGPVREWVLTPQEFDPYEALLSLRADEAMNKPTLTAGDHCLYCPAVGRCQTARRAGYSTISYAQQPYTIETMDGADLAVERDILRTGLTIIKDRLEAIEEDLQHRIKAGDRSGGLSLQATYGREVWSVPVPQAVAAASMFGVDAAKPGVLTPAQVCAKVPAKQRPAVQAAIKSLTKKSTTGLKLVPAEDTVTAKAFRSK